MTEPKVYRPNTMRAVVLAIGIFVVVLVYVGFSLLGLLLGTVFAAFTVWSLLVQRYELQDNGVFIRSGIFARSRGTILYSQIQDVQETQPLIGRLLGFTTLQIKTMGAQAGTMAGLTSNDAAEIKRSILQRMSHSTAPRVATETPGAMPYPIRATKKALFYAIPVAIATMLIIGGAVLFVTLAVSLKSINLILFTNLLLPLLVLGGVIWAVLVINAAIFERAFSYALTEDYFAKKYQFINKYDVHIPYQKIQDLIFKEGPLDRVFGFADVTIETGERMVPQQRNSGQAIMAGAVGPFKRDDASALHERLLRSMGLRKTQPDNLRQHHPLDARKPLKKTAGSAWYLLVLLVIAISIAAGLRSMLPPPVAELLEPVRLAIIAAVLLVVSTIVTLWYEYAYFKSYDYADTTELLRLRKGVFFIDVLTIPYDKIQHIFVDQDVFDRLFGLWDVHVASAGTTGVQLHIDGVRKEDAEALRDLFLQRTKNK